MNIFVLWSTLVCQIDVHARLLILRKKSPLHGLILVCTFIDFEKKFPPARLFHPARLLVLVCMYEQTSCKIKFEVCIRQVFGHKISKTVFWGGRVGLCIRKCLVYLHNYWFSENFPPARLLIFQKIIPLHVYSILHFWFFF